MPKNITYTKLIEGIKSVIERGEYLNFLKIVNRFKDDYSMKNTLLIYSQYPNATCVKGFVKWKKLGRGIKKLHHRIYIYVPIKRKISKEIEGQQDVTGKEIKEKTRNSKYEIIDTIAYVTKPVYDLRDTYALKGKKRIPFIDNKLNSNTTKDLYKRLLNISPVKVEYKQIDPDVDGYYSIKENKIVLQENLSQDDKTATLLHELCHCMYDEYKLNNKNKSEVFTESVAFLVADNYGFDTATNSFEYIITWVKDDFKDFMQMIPKIESASKKFIKLIDENEFKQEKIIA